jgi:hypothetical protein
VTSVSSSFLASNLNGWSYSRPVPSAITKIRSESITVASLWAMTKTVAEEFSV